MQTPTTVSFPSSRSLEPEEMDIIKRVVGAITSGGTVFVIDENVDDWLREDIRQAAENIIKAKTFFYAGDDDLGDEVRRFLIDNPMMSNVEQVVDA